MSRRVVPTIRPRDLRDHADQARIDRIWDRLDRDLPGREQPRPRFATTLVALAAATIGAFSAGIYVGSTRAGAERPTTIRAVAPESSAAQSVLAAGTKTQSYPLPGGGTLTLSPGATVEVEHGDGEALTLHLVRGEASVDTRGAGSTAELALVAEDATLRPSAGSAVFVRRNEADIDVHVTRGSAHVSWPAGSRDLSGGDGLEAIPMRALAPTSRVDETNDVGPKPPRATARIPNDISARPLALPLRPEAPIVAITAPDWRARYNAGDLALALELIRQQPGGIDGAITSARSAQELAAISDIGRKGGDASAALRALTQLVERFPSDPYAEIAAYTLGGMYEKMGQADQAQKYFESARSLKGVLAEDALCKQIRAEHRAGRKDEAMRRGSEYLNKYPDGRCKEDVERILSGDEPAQEDPQASTDAGDADASAP